MWWNDNRFGLYSNANPLLQSAILKMDRWITASRPTSGTSARSTGGPEQARDLQEGCYTKDPTPVLSPSTRCAVYRRATTSIRRTPSARGRRGGHAADIIKCQTKPLKQSSMP